MKPAATKIAAFCQLAGIGSLSVQGCYRYLQTYNVNLSADELDDSTELEQFQQAICNHLSDFVQISKILAQDADEFSEVICSDDIKRMACFCFVLLIEGNDPNGK